MLTRLFFLFRDNPVPFKKNLYLNFLQIFFLLIFEIELSFIIFLVLLIGLNILFFYIEKKSSNKNLARFLSLVSIIILISAFTSSALTINYNRSLLNLIKALSHYFFIFNFIENQNWLMINIITAGFLFLLNEVNFIIRYLFEALSLIPKFEGEHSGEVDEKEYNTGRVIGMLERILILFFVLANQFAAIGFFIAAKGFTRFKELDNKKFAEYFLIGTLLSSLFAVGTALLIKRLINY
jgi:hypothetical protein